MSPLVQPAASDVLSMRRMALLIEGCAARVNLAVVDRTFRDPFWEGKFGDECRRIAEEEGRRDLQYLVEALASHDEAVLCNYARWSRGMLVARGLCSRHLIDAFRRLGEALGDELGDEIGPAHRFLDAAIEALRPDGSPARELHDDAGAIAAEIHEVLETRHPEGSPLILAADDVRTARDARYYVSYLADAFSTSRPELFTSHVAWATTFLERRGVGRSSFRELLDLIADEAAERAPAAALLVHRASRELERVA